MKVELLRIPPISGSIEEHAVSASARANTWIRFDDEQGDEWVGVFGGGGLGVGTSVAPFGDDGGRTVLVLSNGAGYIVDVPRRALVREPDWWFATTAMALPGRAFVAVANDTEAWFAHRDHDRRIWRGERAWYRPDGDPPFHRLALDGIQFDEVEGETLRGKVWEGDGWYGLSVDLNTSGATLGARLTGDWFEFAPASVAG